MEKFRKNCYNLINLKNKGVFGVNKKIIFHLYFYWEYFHVPRFQKGFQ